MDEHDEPNAVVPQEPDADAPQESIDADADPPLITATGLGVDGEHGPLFSGVDLALTAGAFTPSRCPVDRNRPRCC